MAPRPTSVHILTPCAENWAAMTPRGPGRHCAACQKTVIDFSSKTDSEILVLLKQATGSPCGRFRADQLDRPLAPLAVGAPSRWRAWLAAAAAVWGLREGVGATARAAPPVEHRAPRPGKKPGGPPAFAAPRLVVRGVVRDAATGQPVPGAAVFLKSENRRTTTDAAGGFQLRAPAGRGPHGRHTLVLHLFGYRSQTVRVPAGAPAAGGLAIALRADTATGVEVVAPFRERRETMIMGMMPLPGSIHVADSPPEPREPRPARSFFRWLRHPFRRR